MSFSHFRFYGFHITIKQQQCSERLALTFGFKIKYNLISFHKQFSKVFRQMDTNRQLEQKGLFHSSDDGVKVIQKLRVSFIKLCALMLH